MNTQRVRTSFAMALGLLVALTVRADSPPRIGLIAPDRTAAADEESSYAQRKWEEVLRPGPGLLLKGLRFELRTVSDADLASADTLKAYALIVVPEGRTLMAPAGLAALKAYVGEGGILVREGHAVGRPDLNGDGVLNAGTAEVSPKARDDVSAFWREVAGALPAAAPSNFIRRLRFMPVCPALTRGLPAEWVPLDVPYERVALPAAFQTGVYALQGAEALAEAELSPDGDPSSRVECRPVMTFHRHGRGYCVSIGISRWTRVLTKNWSPSLYRPFMIQLVKWAIEQEAHQEE